MQKIIALFALFLTINQTWAKDSPTLGYIDEMEALGTVSGTAMACGSPKYETFEMLARAILVTKAASDEMQAKGMKAFNFAKVKAFVSKQKDSLLDCDEINARFDKQKIFKTTLYRDGTIKMYDGKVFRPRHPYDTTLLEKDENINRENAIARDQNNQNKIDSAPHKQVAAQTVPQPQNIPEPISAQVYSAQTQSTPNIEKSRVRHISSKNR